ncbi:MAG: alpha/beta fold hydrolase [Pseudonocardiaceae bacterium]
MGPARLGVEGIAGALALVSGADEVAAPEFTDVLPVELRGLVDKIASDPAGAEKIFAGFTADAMWSIVTGGSAEADLAVYHDPVFEAAYRRALGAGFAQGPAGYTRDTVLAMGWWQFNLAMINVPVDIWYGEQDRSHSPDNEATLAARIPGARSHVMPGIGGAVLWTHAEPILRSLLE